MSLRRPTVDLRGPGTVTGNSYWHRLAKARSGSGVNRAADGARCEIGDSSGRRADSATTQRNELLQIRPIQQSTIFFAANAQTRRLIAHRSGDCALRETAKESSSQEIIAAIGPEGGWTDDEFKLATDHGFEPVNLGIRIYRVETAATVIAAVLVT